MDGTVLTRRPPMSTSSRPRYLPRCPAACVLAGRGSLSSQAIPGRSSWY